MGNNKEVVEGVVVARPSKKIKTPYVCDMKIIGNQSKETEIDVLAYTPSLGCNGMVDKEAKVIAMKRETGKCGYSVVASRIEEKSNEYIVGVDPSIAEKIAGEILINGTIDGLRVESEKLQKQQTYKDSRFDYCGVTLNNEPFVCEVKNVSIAEYENMSPRELRKMCFDDRSYDSKIAIFPSGYKSKGKVHSERALKHVKTLTEIKIANPVMRCILLFIVQRNDVKCFQPSNGDEIYLNALREAKKVGVEIKAVSIKWIYDKERNLMLLEVDNSNLNVVI